MTYIVDTHALVWFLEDSPRLGRAARAALNEPDAQCVVPMMVLAEIAFLHARGRISLSAPEAMRQLESKANCKLHPFDELVVRHLPTQLNIHDAIIVATALVFRDALKEQTALVTKDGEISASNLMDVVW